MPSALRALVSTANAIIPLSRDGKTDPAMALFRSQTMPAYVQAQGAIESLAKFKKLDGEGKAAIAAASVTSARQWIWTVLALALLSSCGIGWYLSRHINAALSSAVRNLEAATSELKAITAQVAESSAALTSNTALQSASLEQTSASSVEMQAMASRNSENFRMATRDMEQIETKLDVSNRAIQTMVGSMNAIDASNQNVFKIIGVIDGIAFQTNMLALNAAVEAARAGAHGVGFAVVAEEVRNLAQRAAQQARDSSTIIEDLLARSSAGKAQLDAIAGSIGSIAGSATRVKALIHDVESGNEDQARGIRQVSEAVARMEHVTGSTAAIAVQGAAASGNLSAQAEVLRTIVGSLNTLVESSKRRHALNEFQSVRYVGRRVRRSSVLDHGIERST